MLLKMVTVFLLMAAATDKVANTAVKPKNIRNQEKTPMVTTLTSRYRLAKMVEMNVEKTVYSELVGKTTKHTGKIYLMGELFRFDTKSPDETEVIFDGKTLWTVQHPSAEFGGDLVVSKQAMNAKSQSQVFLSSLLMRENIKNHFKIISEKTDDKNQQVVIVVKPLSQQMNISQLELKVDIAQNKNLVRQVSYEDEVGNKTTFYFPEVFFNTTKNANLFKYTAPKGVKVIEL